MGRQLTQEGPRFTSKPLPIDTKNPPLFGSRHGDIRIRLDIFTLFLAWSIAEIIRYGYFSMKVLNLDVHLMTWLRYTGFIVLYPLGVARYSVCSAFLPTQC